MKLTKFVVPTVLAGALIATISLGADAAEPKPMGAQATAASIPNTKGAVTGWHLADGTIYGADINPAVVKWFTGTWDNTVTTNSVKNGALGEVDLNKALTDKINSTAGKVTGLESDSPYPGGDNKPLQAFPGNGSQSTDKWVGNNGATLQKSWVKCADGKVAIGAGFDHGDEGAAAYKALQIVSTTLVELDKDGKEVWNPIKGDAAGSIVPNAVRVDGFNNGDAALIVRPTITCVNLG